MSSKNNPTEPAVDRMLIITREFDAPRDLVWRAWTEPEQIKQWLRADDGMVVESVKTDLRIGGRFRTQMKSSDGEYYTAAGHYLEVKPPERVVYTWDWEKDGSGTEFGEMEGNQSRVTVELRAIGKRTELVLTHENLASKKSRDSHQKGWTTWLERMAKFIGTKS